MGWNPAPKGEQVVERGGYRFTVITDRVLRVSSRSASDSATMQVKNRYVGSVPSFSVKNLSSTIMEIQTSAVNFTVDFSTIGNQTSSCAHVEHNMDKDGGGRVPGYPNGIPGLGIDGCCAKCDSVPGCTAFVLEPSTNTCWLTTGSTGTKPANDRVVGRRSSCFMSSAFSATFDMGYGKMGSWKGGDESGGNLGGVQSFLDCYTTPKECVETYVSGEKNGVLSRDGWVVLDDNLSGRLEGTMSDGGIGPWFSAAPPPDCDFYLLFHGLNYSNAAKEWGLVSGAHPMIDRGYLGPWWSRHGVLGEAGNKDIFQHYADNNLPLGVAVADMQWHTGGYMAVPSNVNGPGDSCKVDDDDGLFPPPATQEQPKDTQTTVAWPSNCEGWGGFDWNTSEAAFPDPTAYASYLHTPASNPTKGAVRLSLNVHVETGVDPCQSTYKEFAEAMGQDPAMNKTVTCAFGNKTFVTSLFDIILDRDNRAPVDVWWTDWKGCGGPEDVGYDSTLAWSNYVFASHQVVARSQRPMALSRRGGLGDHIWPTGFSGDVFQSWDILQYEVNFTARAGAGALQSWSHDVGGFHRNGAAGSCVRGDGNTSDPKSALLYMRWLQAAAFWPIMRTHCRFCTREVWLFEYYSEEMMEALRLRGSLIPYLYTAFHKLSTLSAPHPVRSLFVDFPLEDDAYKASEFQFFFGPDITVAPITSPGEIVSTPIWVPPGTWISWDGMSLFTGPQLTTISANTSTIPILVKGGAILPLQDSRSHPGDSSPSVLRLAIYPGSEKGETEVFEDDGVSLHPSSTTTTKITSTWNATAITITIHPTQSTLDTRLIDLEVRSFPGPPINASIDGTPIQPSTSRPGYSNIINGTLVHPANTLLLQLPPIKTMSGASIFIGL